MSPVVHHTVIVIAPTYLWDTARTPDTLAGPDVDAFRARMPEDLRRLVQGPFPSVVNGYATYVFVSSGLGSTSEMQDVGVWRRAFADLFQETYDDGSSPFLVTRIQLGPDDDGFTRLVVDVPVS